MECSGQGAGGQGRLLGFSESQFLDLCQFLPASAPAAGWFVLTSIGPFMVACWDGGVDLSLRFVADLQY